MRRGRSEWALGLALATAMLFPLAAQAKENQAPVAIGSLSGAYLAARTAEADNDLDAAISYYERAVGFDPSNESLKQSLLVALIANGDFDKALPLAEDLKTVPDVERFSRVALSIDAFRKKDYADAEFLLKLALESDLDRLITGLMTAWAKAGAGDGKAALAQIAGMKGPAWYDLFVGYHKALIAEFTGDQKGALDAFKAVAGNPTAAGAAPETWLRAVEAYAGHLARAGKKQDALAVIDAADQVFTNRVQLVELRKRIEAGAKIAQLVPGPSDGASEVLLNLGSALNRGGGEGFVRLYLRMALALRPDSDAALIQLAGVAEQMRNPEEAIELYGRIPEGSSVKKVAELQLGLNLADLERNQEAILHLKKVLEHDQNDMRAYLALGGVYSAEKQYRDAADIYDTAVGRIAAPSRNDWNVFYQRGIAYERLKEWDKAEPNFHKALELFPEQPQVLNYLGYSWVDMNIKLEEGLELIRQAVDLRPSDGYIVDSLGWAYYRLGRYEDATRELERAVSLMPSDPVLNDHLGDAYWRVGRKLEAGFQWSHARSLDPEPDIKAGVEKKLVEGLPPVKPPSVAADPAPQPPAAPAPADKRTDASPAVTPSVEKAALTTPAPAAVPASHVVSRGQSLWTIAVERLGDGRRFRELLDLNPELKGDPGRIVPGQSLRLPVAN